MGLFDKIFGKQFKDDSSFNLEENSDHWADSITTGWEYRCNLYLTTPKVCLENDGLIIFDNSKKPELFGEPNQFGPDGDPSGSFGNWTRRHGYEEKFEELANITENMNYARPSDIGRIPSKSDLEKNFIEFLIDFRRIFETSSEVQVKLFKIKNILSIKSETYKNIYKRLVSEKQFPEEFFKNEICCLNGVNKTQSEIFWKAGYFSPDEILNTPDKILIELDGVNKSLLAKIRKK